MFVRRNVIAADMSRAARDVLAGGRGSVVGYFPVARQNPFQALLYSEAETWGACPVPLFDYSDIRALTVPVGFGVSAVLHLHWTARITGDCSTPEEAKAATDQFLGKVEDLADAGVRTIWTIHNALPHGCPFPEIEAEFRQKLADRVDLIHAMTPDTSDAVSPFYSIDKRKVFYIPHPSYLGAYPTHHSRSMARFELGFDSDDVVIGSVGSLQMYKGLDLLADAGAVSIEHVPRLRFVVAGAPSTEPGLRPVLEALERIPEFHIWPRRVDDQVLARVFGALDAVVLPYRASLNSGAAILALSFGLPVVAPRIGSFEELSRHGLCLAYEPNDRDALAKALIATPEFVEGFDRDAARQWTHERRPEAVSNRFFSAIENGQALGGET